MYQEFFIASLILGIIHFILVFLFNIGFKIISIEEYQLGGIIARLVNLSSLFLFWSVIYFAVHYLENYKKAEIESLIFEAAVKDFELKTLKAQLNPHFIFNAMNSIRALIEEDPESAKKRCYQTFESDALHFEDRKNRDCSTC